MASRKIILEPGAWYAGIHTPWYVPNSMIASALESRGLTDVAFHERAEPLPGNVQPRSDPRYRDTWDTWVSARFSGASRSVQIDHYEFIDWLLRIPPAKPGSTEQPGPRPSPKPAPATTDLLANVLDPETLGRHLIAGFVAARMTHNLIVKVVLTIVLDEALVVAEAKAKSRMQSQATSSTAT